MQPNLYTLPVPLPAEELTTIIASGPNTRIERIVSTGQSSPEDFWYDQDEDEWVFLLQGRATLVWQDGTTTDLDPGGHLLIPARKKHRVLSTSKNPPCIWIAVFSKLENSNS